MRTQSKQTVRKMTLPWRGRRLSVAYCLLPKPLLLMLLLHIGSPGRADSSDLQSVEDISAAAEAYLLQRLGHWDPQTSVRAGQLDSRLRLPLCDRPLEPFMRRGAKIGSRSIVGVRCSGHKAWKVYIPVDVIVTKNVLVTRRSLPRGHLLTNEDLVSEQRDVNRLVAGYITRPRELLGQRLKHQLIAGRIITPAMLQADRVIRRGQSVTLTVQNKALNIRMSGKALTDGAIGHRIRVKNTNSGRIVEGIVRSPEHVEILIFTRESFSNAMPKESAMTADTRLSNNDR